ncbi:MAG: restriction endonuclease subunit S, partial [Nitrospiraceae bacterium]
EFKTIQIALPPKAEQLEIAKFIENETRKLDSLKTEAERAISLLKERRNALIGAAVTGQIDVRSAAPQVAVKCSEAIAA